MPIQPLDQIVLRKTIIGIACPVCSGADFEAQEIKGHSLLQQIRLLFGRNATTYLCRCCQSRFTLYRNRRLKGEAPIAP